MKGVMIANPGCVKKREIKRGLIVRIIKPAEAGQDIVK